MPSKYIFLVTCSIYVSYMFLRVNFATILAYFNEMVAEKFNMSGKEQIWLYSSLFVEVNVL